MLPDGWYHKRHKNQRWMLRSKIYYFINTQNGPDSNYQDRFVLYRAKV